MSILIKNMEMPKNCGECQFCHTENFKQWCCPTGREDIFYDAIPEWCPLEKPKTGEWNVLGEWVSSSGCYGVAYCSECNYELRGNNTNFCPNCGSDMRGNND